MELGGGNSNIFFWMFIPIWGNGPIWLAHIFLMGLVQPPSSVAKSWRFFGGFRSWWFITSGLNHPCFTGCPPMPPIGWHETVLFATGFPATATNKTLNWPNCLENKLRRSFPSTWVSPQNSHFRCLKKWYFLSYVFQMGWWSRSEHYPCFHDFFQFHLWFSLIPWKS